MSERNSGTAHEDFEAARGHANSYAPPGAYRISRTYFDLSIDFGRENNSEAAVAAVFEEMKHVVPADLLRRLETGRRGEKMSYVTPMGGHGMNKDQMDGWNRAVATIRGET